MPSTTLPPRSSFAERRQQNRHESRRKAREFRERQERMDREHPQGDGVELRDEISGSRAWVYFGLAPVHRFPPPDSAALLSGVGAVLGVAAARRGACGWSAMARRVAPHVRLEPVRIRWGRVGQATMADIQIVGPPGVLSLRAAWAGDPDMVAELLATAVAGLADGSIVPTSSYTTGGYDCIPSSFDRAGVA